MRPAVHWGVTERTAFVLFVAAFCGGLAVFTIAAGAAALTLLRRNGRR